MVCCVANFTSQIRDFAPRLFCYCFSSHRAFQGDKLIHKQRASIEIYRLCLKYGQLLPRCWVHQSVGQRKGMKAREKVNEIKQPAIIQCFVYGKMASPGGNARNL